MVQFPMAGAVQPLAPRTGSKCAIIKETMQDSNNRSTPETDAEEIILATDREGRQVSCVSVEFARRMERERNEAREGGHEAARRTIHNFIERVERRAEEKMLKTGKLEGAHYAAMKQLQADMEGGGEPQLRQPSLCRDHGCGLAGAGAVS